MKYVAFDIGNVLVHSNFNGFIWQLSKDLNITTEEATYFMNRSQKLHDLGLTNMSDELMDHFKIRSQPLREELIGKWNDVIQPAPEVLEMIDRLERGHGLQVALLSNVGLEHAERMSQVLGKYKFFANATQHFSCHVGARKPNLLYYHTFLELHPEWKGCPYIDDLAENLGVGARFGFKPYRFSLNDVSNEGWQEKYPAAIDNLESFILGRSEPPNPRWH